MLAGLAAMAAHGAEVLPRGAIPIDAAEWPRDWRRGGGAS